MPTHRPAWSWRGRSASPNACSARPGATTLRASGSRRLRRRVLSGQRAGAATPQPPRRRRQAPAEPHRDLGRVRVRARVSWSAAADAGELSISAYALVRYINQTPAEQTFTDHLGNERNVDGRNDIYSAPGHALLQGLAGHAEAHLHALPLDREHHGSGRRSSPSSATSSTASSVSMPASTALPGTRSLQGSHPYWLGHDRVMADEFFRPYFAYGVWAQGEITPGLWYNAMVGNNSSALGITATQLIASSRPAPPCWWMPTTKEFGPRGAYGDWEWHDKLATRVRRLQRRTAPRSASPTRPRARRQHASSSSLTA